DSQIEEDDKKLFKEYEQRLGKRYNLTQTARILRVHRQTIYHWIKKGWCKPRRDYRNYPVFTVLDIENLIKWRNTMKSE
ncbi:MAG: MerR family transcriptional regulator, partial [Candidatus Omnitrophica bacterium]|nr:MerR family transcriptional regulator [Candidatus Omnitrophota bacterium]